MTEMPTIGTKCPKTKLEIKNLNSVEAIEAEIKLLQSKLEFYKKLEKTKSPVEKAYKDAYGLYPITDGMSGGDMDYVSWDAFQKGYNAAYEVVEYQPTPQTPEQVADGLKEAFREAVKQGVVSSSTKSQTLTDLIYDWWCDVFTTNSNDDMETSIDSLVTKIAEWLPTEHETNSYKWNQCIRTIREKLR